MTRSEIISRCKECSEECLGLAGILGGYKASMLMDSAELLEMFAGFIESNKEIEAMAFKKATKSRKLKSGLLTKRRKVKG